MVASTLPELRVLQLLGNEPDFWEWFAGNSFLKPQQPQAVEHDDQAGAHVGEHGHPQCRGA